MEMAAIQGEKSMCPSDVGGPKSSREKFLQAWYKKLKPQTHPTVSSQVSGSPVCAPSQENWTKDTSLSHTIYYLMVVPPPQAQLYASSWTTAQCPRQRDLHHVAQELASSSLDPEANPKEEFLHICASDLLLKSAERKRPRLLPPNRKMHVEVLKRQDSPPLQECQSRPVPLEYSHLLDTIEMTNPADLPQVEGFYRSFIVGQRRQGSSRRAGQLHPQPECRIPPRATEAASCQQGARRITRMRYTQHRKLSLKRSAPLSELTVATKRSVDSSQNGHLPPKKRYTQGFF
ncbi:uncharacterized protein LOC117039121 [Lacerta agilis]|uniref:uncharacterized protein LOC117039121 n=1 Tax=Lacerta agilis TaxID=80427 RepID=UPI00141A3FA4|nr:uncharacterized protein LOC117039121 [Lacerta agilis]